MPARVTLKITDGERKSVGQEHPYEELSTSYHRTGTVADGGGAFAHELARPQARAHPPRPSDQAVNPGDTRLVAAAGRGERVCAGGLRGRGGGVGTCEGGPAASGAAGLAGGAGRGHGASPTARISRHPCWPPGRGRTRTGEPRSRFAGVPGVPGVQAGGGGGMAGAGEGAGGDRGASGEARGLGG